MNRPLHLGRALRATIALACVACTSPRASSGDATAEAAIDASLDASEDSALLDVARVERAPLPPPSCPITDASRPEVVPGPLTVVRVEAGASAPLQLAVQACVGLRNRASPGSAFVNANAHDAAWIRELGLTPVATVSAEDFVRACAAEIPTCVRYDYASQRPLLPNILTAAAALGALPLDRSLSLTCASTAFDAITELRDYATPALATQYVFDRFAAQTTGLAMLNPGYELAPMEPANARITRDMGSALVDFVFSQRLFVVFLVNGCTNGNPEKTLLSRIVNSGRWPEPVAVYGYNNSWNLGGGYLHEAQTLCLDSHNMGAIASEASNLSFFSTRAAPITQPGEVRQNAPESVTYDPSRTYVAFVIGDGDNIDYMLSTRREWLQQRVASCQAAGATCPPLTWSISSHLTRLAPDVLRWYYDQSRRTGRDYFALPPSGHLYAYPTSLAPRVQDRFVAATERDACALGVTGTVHWDWAGTWEDAERLFLPKYARLGGPIRGVFPINVPYLIPTFTWWPQSRFYDVLTGADGGQVALFKPRQWRGVSSDTDRFRLRPQRMADEISNYPRGTITWVYMTSDGGLTFENAFVALTAMLPPHVQLVSTDTAAQLAIAAGRR
jgi:hypothetical protein